MALKVFINRTDHRLWNISTTKLLFIEPLYQLFKLIWIGSGKALSIGEDEGWNRRDLELCCRLGVVININFSKTNSIVFLCQFFVYRLWWIVTPENSLKTKIRDDDGSFQFRGTLEFLLTLITLQGGHLNSCIWRVRGWAHKLNNSKWIGAFPGFWKLTMWLWNTWHSAENNRWLEKSRVQKSATSDPATTVDSVCVPFDSLLGTWWWHPCRR